MADGFSSNLQKWDDRADNPAAPAGMQQAAATAADPSSPGFESNLNKWVTDDGLSSSAQSWYTGANREGQANGWSTDFWERAMTQTEELTSAGTLANQFVDAEDNKATGVVLYDHTDRDGYRQFKFGDIYDNGKLVGNIYDQFKDDRATADMMMADMLFDGSTKTHLFSEAKLDPEGRVENKALADAVDAARKQNVETYQEFLSQSDFNSKVEKRADEFGEGTNDDILTSVAGAAGAGSIVGGAMMATGVGFVPGAAVTGISALVGGAAAWANRDTINEQAARAFEITSMSNRENGTGAAVFTGISQWSGVAAKAISPLGNIVQGGSDAFYGRTGDGRGEFYRIDKDGERVVPNWMKAADVVATVGDSLLQFASPIGLNLYTAQMTGVIAGEVGELGMTGGRTFDYHRGGFDNIFTDDEGNFSATQAMAGIGKVGIDVVQLGMARGLASKVGSARTEAGKTSLFGALPGSAKVGEAMSRLPKWAGGFGKDADAARAALASGGRTVELGGKKYVVDAAGTAVGSRATLSLLAPSEQVQALGARVSAMRASAKSSGALSADDFYRAANSLAMGERKITTALLNAMGEGYEEAAQAFLEPYSHEQSASGEEIGMAAVYGAAAGMGMGLGMAARMPSADDRMFGMAQTGFAMRTGGVELTRTEWNSLSDVQKRTLASMAGLEKSTMDAAYKKFVEDQSAEHTAGVIGVNKLANAIQSTLAQQLAKATDRTDGAFVITQIEDVAQLDANGDLLPHSMPNDAIASSGTQLAHNLLNHLRGVAIQQDYLQEKVDELKATADPADADAQAQIAGYEKQIALAEKTLEWGQWVETQVEQAVTSMNDPAATPATIEADAIALNLLLRQAFNRQIDMPKGQPITDIDKMALARAVSLVFARDPHDSSTSYQVLVPQVSAALAMTGSDNVVEISHALLPGLRGDYDGDKVRQLAQLVLDETEYTNARSGVHLIGAGVEKDGKRLHSVNIGAPKYEQYVTKYMAEALTGSRSAALQAEASATLVTIGDALRRRYAGLIGNDVLDQVLQSFYDQVHAGAKDARAALLDGLADKAGAQITEKSRGDLTNEWLWIDQLVRATFSQFQEMYAEHRPDTAEAPDTTLVAPKKLARRVRERRAAQAATDGQTYGLWLAGDSQFRGSQKLHYTSLVAAVMSAEMGGSRAELYELAQAYEALGQGLTSQELAAIRGKDDITTRVYAQLLRMSESGAEALSKQLGRKVSRAEALPVLANMRVLDIDVAEDGAITDNRRQISLAQLLLKFSIVKDKREKAAILEISPELQAKHARLEEMTRPGSRDNPVNAERAFVEVVGAQQLYTLLGDEAGIFGPHLTVEQFLRGYVSKSERDRREEARALRRGDAYLGRKEPKDLPYDLSEVLAGEITPYRAVVDAIVAVGNNRITIDEKGNLNGEFADRSDRTSKSFREFHATARRALLEFEGLSPREDGDLDIDTVVRLLQGNPDFFARLVELIPNVAARAVIQPDGEISNWFYSIFTIRNSKEAEMHYWRNLLMAETNALNAAQNARSEENAEQKGREFSRLPRRMHRIIWNLAADAHLHGGLMMQRFIKELETATDPDQFMRWINLTPGIRGDQAPLTLWVDDVAEFDKDKAGGGWTTALQGAELREAIGNLQKSTHNLLHDLAEERNVLADDTQTMLAIRKVIKADAGDTSVTVTTEERRLYDKFVTAINEAGELAMGLGPQAMLYEIVGAVRGFNAQSHTKGKNPQNVSPYGAFDAQRDAYDYVTNYERVMGALTSVNLDAVGGNLSQVAKDGGRTMDDYGRTVEWGKPTPAQMLELLSNADTRPLARAILFPQVMERTLDGRLSPQLLVGKTLGSLLNGTAHNALFPKDEVLSNDSALRYLSMVEAMARTEEHGGGHFAVTRLVNDLAIARTSAADHVLTTYEIEQIATTAMYDVARVLQASGSIAATWEAPFNDPLEPILKQVRDAQRTASRKTVLGLMGEEMVLEEMIRAREAEMVKELRELTAKANAAAGTVDHVTLQQQLADAQRDADRFKKRAELLLADNMAAHVVEMFTIPADPIQAASTKDAIVEYVRTHLTLLERSSATMVTLNKLTNQLLDSGRAGQVDLTDKEWAELSRAVIAVYIDDVVSLTAAGVSVPPFPDLDSEMGRNQARYYDTSFSYLAEPLLDSNHPVVRAARALHLRAGRHGVVTPKAELLNLFDKTIFKQHSLGAWTSDIPRASGEANERLFSAAAEPGIAMPGNSAKRQAVISAATRRTFEVPPDALLSQVALTWTDLNKSEFDEVAVAMPGGAVVNRPLVQLSNRFAKSVTLTYTDAAGALQTVDLMAADRDLGRPWVGSEKAAGSGLQEIHLDRVRRAVDVYTTRLKLDPMATQVSVTFFHPDSQPVEIDPKTGADKWMNNLYFEGTSFKLDADRHESLNATLWFANGSINPVAQAAALDASKLGLPALKTVPTPTAADRQAMESYWRTELDTVLRYKTRIVLESDLGFGTLDPEFYNAVYKDMKLRHFVRGTVDGKEVLWTAEQVLAHQFANPGVALPIDDAALFVPTDDVLRSMLGEQGTQGVARLFGDRLEIDASKVKTYRGVTPEMLKRFLAGVKGEAQELHETRIANRARQSQLMVRAMLDDTTRATHDAKIRFFAEMKSEIHTDRSLIPRIDAGGFNPRSNLARMLVESDKFLRAENIAFDWSAAGVGFIGPRNLAETALSSMLLHDLTASLAQDNFRTGWIYEEGSSANPVIGLLSEVSLGNQQRAGHTVAPGDPVLVKLDKFEGDLDLAKKRIDYLTGRGAIVVLGQESGQSDLRNDLAVYLEGAGGYERIAGSGHVYQPLVGSPRYQNQKARLSSMTEMRGVSRRSHVTVLNVLDKVVEENAAWKGHDSERLAAVAVQMNLIPTDFLAGFNVPVTPAQLEQVRAHLRGLNTTEGRQLLRDQAADKKWKPKERATAEKALDVALDRMLTRFDDHPGQVLPQPGDEFGTGDLIPLVDNHGRVLLYRHGFKAPRRDQVDDLARMPLSGSTKAHNVAIYPSKTEPTATTHIGTVVRINPRATHGLAVELDIPLQQFGDKKVLEWNGMKYLLTPRPKSIVLPDHGFFANGWGIDLIASAHDMASKESFDGTVNNHRNAFAYFGVDFLPDVAKFFGTDQNTARELLHAIARHAPRITVSAADELINADRLTATFRELLPAFAATQAGLANAGWVDKLADTSAVEAKIAAGIIVYLMTPGARVADVLGSGGFNDASSDADAQSVLMPRLFTQMFDNAPLGSELRNEMFRRFNQQMFNPNTDGTGYSLAQDWTFEVRNKDRKKNLRGFLQFAEAHSSGDNPVKNGMAFDDTARGGVSQHTGNVAYQAIGAETAFKYDLDKARAFAEGKGLEHFERDVVDGGMWRMLTNISTEDRDALENWRRDTPAAAARRHNAREEVAGYRQELDTTDDALWTPAQRNEYRDAALAVTRKLGLQDSQIEIVDFWVRQMLGRPHGRDEAGNPQDRISGKAAIDTAGDILWNVERFYLPTTSGMQPLMHVHDLQLIRRANENKAKWAPRNKMTPDSTKATTWQEWVEVALGSAVLTEDNFDPLYLLALDGFMHSYQTATRSLLDLPVSMDAFKSVDLLNPETNQMLLSLSEDQNLLAAEPMLTDMGNASLDDLIGGRRIPGRFSATAAPASEVARRREALRKWRKENDVPMPVNATMKDLRKNGAQFIDRGTTANALARALINLRVGTATINPALYVSMGPEQWYRGTLDRAANLLTGQGTTGTIAKSQARISEAMQGTALGKAAEAFGVTTRYTPEQIAKLGKLYDQLGQRNDFQAMVFRDLMFLRPHMAGIHKIEKWLEAYAKFGSRMQDPTWGMRSKTLARRYVEAALQHILASPLEHTLTVDTLIAEMKSDPQFLQKNYPDAHIFASNAVAQIRSLKQTVGNKTLQGIINPMAESSHGGVNFFGNVVLKVPFIFSGYAMNVLTTLTGMQGLDQMTAMILHGRDKGFLGKIQAKLRGDEFNAEDNAFDMTDVLEGIDLSRAFLRGGLTHAGLFMFGMMAGGLGLSGEDDETRKRRRLAELQGVPFMYDKRRIENDFRNSDAVFVDNIPFLDNYFRVTGEKMLNAEGEVVDAPGGSRSMLQLHWTLKQFISPMMGMEKFFETGDLNHVVWGFEDALGSFPLVNAMSWSDAVETGHEMASMAKDQEKLGGPTNMVASAALLANFVGTYERMLFENAFVNMIYTGHDRYDRDPYKLPLTDSDGDLQKDIEGNVRENDLALESYIDPETGEVRQGYMGRDTLSGTLHALTENRASLAAFMWLLPGTADDYNRYSMPKKERTIERPAVTQDEAEAMVRAALQGQAAQGKGMKRLTAEEITYGIKGQAMEAGNWKLWNRAEKLGAEMAQSESFEPMTLLGKDGREVLTKAGAWGVFRGLAKGAVDLGADSLAGIHIPKEMRDEIQKEWMAELIQEGVDLGLDKTKATSRMKRLWYGPSDDPTIQGIGDILWNKDISYSDKVTYKQLNTTYVMGPDGRPWATGWTRDGIMGALGLKPAKRAYVSEQSATGNDNLLNTTDMVNGMNTGLRALELVDDTSDVPTDVEIGKAIEDAIREAANKEFTPFEPFDSKKKGGGYSGGRGYSSGGYFNKMYALPHGVTPYGNSVPFINTSNPIIRRADVRRERIWSERGRLKQWQ